MDPWLPIGHRLPDGALAGPLLHEGADWQVIRTDRGRALLAETALVQSWEGAGLAPAGAFEPARFGARGFGVLASSPDHMLEPVPARLPPRTGADALAFALALARSRQSLPQAPLGGAVFAERIGCLLPVPEGAALPDGVILGTWLSGGIVLDATSPGPLDKILPWLGAEGLRGVIAAAGLTAPAPPAAPAPADRGPFTLPGRPALAAFFNDHVIDLVTHPDRYRAVGLGNPGAVILHGPPGCGKTFAVERLIDHLGWPSFRIEAGSVASPWIHETSRKVAEVFGQAIGAAPSVLVIDEMEAFLADRDTGSGHHRVEEMAEFLRRIPEAVEAGVLIIGMTNRIEMIDAAIRRRGRFDHVIAVPPAGADEVEGMMEAALAAIPRAADLQIPELARRLAGRPLSDVAFVLREGARLAARAGRDRIAQADLEAALAAAPDRDAELGEKRRIGFI